MNTEIEQIIQHGESERIEFKVKENEHFFQTISAFANTIGGTILLGVNDNGKVVGVDSSSRYPTDLTNRIVNGVTIRPSISTVSLKGRRIISISVPKTDNPVAYRGHWYVRIGNTTREITSEELRKKLLHSIRWDAMTGNFSISEINTDTVARFLGLAKEKGRLTFTTKQEKVETILEKLDLIHNGKLTNASILTFGKEPQKYFNHAVVRIGRFKKPITIIADKWVKGNLFDQLVNSIEIIQSFIGSEYRINGLVRDEIWDYPLDAIREATLNALTHRDYLDDSETTIKIYDDLIQFYNPGELDKEINIADLILPSHRSKLRNKLIANVFYLAGLIEKWGTGTHRIVQSLKNAGLSGPMFESRHGFYVTFYKDMYTKDILKQQNLNERQIKGILYAKEHGHVTNKVYQQINSVSNKTAYTELLNIMQKGILCSEGRGRSLKYRAKSIHE